MFHNRLTSGVAGIVGLPACDSILVECGSKPPRDIHIAIPKLPLTGSATRSAGCLPIPDFPRVVSLAHPDGCPSSGNPRFLIVKPTTVGFPPTVGFPLAVGIVFRQEWLGS